MDNPYTVAEMESMMDAGTWNGGCVEGMGYVGTGATIYGYSNPGGYGSDNYDGNNSGSDWFALYWQNYGYGSYGSYGGAQNTYQQYMETISMITNSNNHNSQDPGKCAACQRYESYWNPTGVSGPDRVIRSDTPTLRWLYNLVVTHDPSCYYNNK